MDHPREAEQRVTTSNDSYASGGPLGFVVCLTLLAAVVTGLAFWSWIPVAIGGVVAVLYVLLEMSDRAHTRAGRSP